MSEIRATTISDTAGTGPVTLTKQSAAKAFLHFDHTSNTVRQSLNVSSVTDNATGHFTKSYASSMSSDYHVVTACGHESGTGPASDRFTAPARGTGRILSTASQFVSGDYPNPTVLRDQNVCVTSSLGDLA